jgi:hypothetical protein
VLKHIQFNVFLIIYIKIAKSSDKVPKYEKQDVKEYLIEENSEVVRAFCDACKELSICASPNFYLRQGDNTFDASFW